MPESLPMNPWEEHALNRRLAHQDSPEDDQGNPQLPFTQNDPLVFPGLYSPTGLDIMTLLVQIHSRPNPVIDLGPVDCSVSFTICNLELTDAPIVYASDGFYELTGYSPSQVLGRNCRFLQCSPHHRVGPRVSREALQEMSQAVRQRKEIQLQVDNYKNNGRHFVNMLSIIPFQLGSAPCGYAIGFQSEL